MVDMLLHYTGSCVGAARLNGCSGVLPRLSAGAQRGWGDFVGEHFKSARTSLFSSATLHKRIHRQQQLCTVLQPGQRVKTLTREMLTNNGEFRFFAVASDYWSWYANDQRALRGTNMRCTVLYCTVLHCMKPTPQSPRFHF